jgi:hypothetical protein
MSETIQSPLIEAPQVAGCLPMRCLRRPQPDVVGYFKPERGPERAGEVTWRRPAVVNTSPELETDGLTAELFRSGSPTRIRIPADVMIQRRS